MQDMITIEVPIRYATHEDLWYQYKVDPNSKNAQLRSMMPVHGLRFWVENANGDLEPYTLKSDNALQLAQRAIDRNKCFVIHEPGAQEIVR